MTGAVLDAPRAASWWRQGAIVAGLLAAATALCFLLDERLSVTSQAMVYVLAVVIASQATSLRMALACSLASVVLLNYLFIPPRFAFHVDADENVAALVAMSALAVVISQTGAALRRKAEQARVNEARARQLQHLATDLAGVTTREAALGVVQRFLAAAFGAGCTTALLEPQAQPRQGPGPQGWCIPLASDHRTEGVAHVPEPAVRDPRDLEHAQALCALAGQALSRLALAASMEAAQESARWHRVQGTFLAGISHDFRTPLAAMVTAASLLQAQRDRLGAQEHQRLTQVILEEARHLAALTENTLQFARLGSAGEIRTDWQSVEEIVGSVLARMRGREGSARIHARVPPGLPLIRADSVLVAQLLENLVDNALQYSDGEVEIVAARAGGQVQVAVLDRGPGIADGAQEALFEPYRRGDRPGQRGAGLGLAVCRAIARAHGGEVAYRPRDGGGSCFVLQLPVPAQALPEEAGAPLS